MVCGEGYCGTPLLSSPLRGERDEGGRVAAEDRRVVACGHDGPYGASVCAHLLPPYDENRWFVRWYIGEGMDADFLCEACLALREQGESVDLLAVCWQCRRDLSYWGAGRADIGTPGVVERPQPVDLSLRETA